MKILNTQVKNGWSFKKFYFGNYAKALRIAKSVASIPEGSSDQLARYWYDATAFIDIIEQNSQCLATVDDYHAFLALRRFFNSFTLIDKR